MDKVKDIEIGGVYSSIYLISASFKQVKNN